MAIHRMHRPHEVVDSVRRLVAFLGQSARSVEDRTGVTNAQAFVLCELLTDGALTINDIAERTMTLQSTASLLVKRLEQSGLVARTRSAEDARRVEVSLTAAGRRLARRVPSPPLSRLLSALESLPPARIRDLNRGLHALLTTMGAPSGRSAPLFEAND